MKSLQTLIPLFETLFQEEIGRIGKTQPIHLYEPITYSLTVAGKRMRPALLLHATSLFRKDLDLAVSAAMAIEVFHNFTLLHDDIMDKADIRRGLSTVHKKYNENIAILSGDAMSILAFRYLSQITHPSQNELLKLFSKTALEVCEGQQLDMDFENRKDVTLEEYLEMIRLKTAVLVACSLKMGALLGDASQEQANLLYDFGINIGIAFQLQDDWLDVFGDPLVFGKKIGGDICANKKTYLLIKALETSDTDLKNRLHGWIAAEDFDEKEKISSVRTIYDLTGAAENTREQMHHYHQKAMNCLQGLQIPEQDKQPLIEFADQVINRIK